MSEPIDTGGPAFPQPEQLHTEGRGMNLRDWFAGQALAGILSNPESSECHIAATAETAYRLADAMLKERAK